MSFWSAVRGAFTRATSRQIIRVDAGVSIPDLPLYAQYQRIGGPITPEQVTSVIAQADTGIMWPLVTLFGDARRKDCHLQTVLFAREMAVASLPYEVQAPEGSSPRGRDARVAAWWNEALEAAAGGPQDTADLIGFRGLLGHLQGGVGHGYALAETVCEKDSGKLRPLGWNPVGAGRVLFDQLTGRPHWYDPIGTTGYPGVDLRKGFAPGKIVFHQPRITGDEPTREGLARVLLWAALFRNWSLRDWVALGELAWKPWRKGKYKKGADKKDIDELRNILRNMSASGVALIPDTTELEVEWAKGNLQGATHKEMAEFLAAEMSKATVGQTLTTEQGDRGARSLGDVHKDVKAEITAYDATCVAETVRREIIAPLTRRNFGPDVAIPSFRFLIKESVDLLKFAQGVGTLKDRGLKIGTAYVYDVGGIPVPKEGEEILGEGVEIDIPIDPATGLPAEPPDPPAPPADTKDSGDKPK